MGNSQTWKFQNNEATWGAQGILDKGEEQGRQGVLGFRSESEFEAVRERGTHMQVKSCWETQEPQDTGAI